MMEAGGSCRLQEYRASVQTGTRHHGRHVSNGSRRARGSARPLYGITLDGPYPIQAVVISHGPYPHANERSAIPWSGELVCSYKFEA